MRCRHSAGNLEVDARRKCEKTFDLPRIHPIDSSLPRFWVWSMNT